MRIWILNHYAIARDGAGPNSHAILARYLHQAGHEITLFPGSIGLSQMSPLAIPRGDVAKDFYEDGVRYRCVRTPSYRNVAGRLLNMAIYRTNVCRSTSGLERPDVIIGSCVHPWAVDAAIRLAVRYRIPFVYQIRDIWPETLVNMRLISKYHPLYWYFRRIELKAFGKAAGVTSVLPGITEYAAIHGISAERVCYLPNGIDPAAHPDPGQPASPLPFVVSYFGAHGLPNALDVLIRAATIVQNSPYGGDIQFRLIGDGPEKSRLMLSASRLGLRNIEFRNRVTKASLWELAIESHMFVFTHPGYKVVQRYGLSCNKLFDYLAAARPIAFSADSLNDPVKEAGAGISSRAGDAQGLAGAIVGIRRMSADERIAMGQRGRRYVLANHDLRKLAGRLEEFLIRVTADANGRRLRCNRGRKIPMTT